MENKAQSDLNGTPAWEEKVFGDARLTRLVIEMFDDELAEMRAYLTGGEFESENEGWRFLLTAGYTYLRAQERLRSEEDTAGPNPIGAEENLRRLIEIEAMYAVMKQRAYTWRTDFQTMSMQTGALHTMVNGFGAKAGLLQEENQTLKDEIARLSKLLTQLTSSASATASDAAPVRPTPSRLKRLLGRDERDAP